MAANGKDRYIFRGIFFENRSSPSNKDGWVGIQMKNIIPLIHRIL